MSMVQEVEVQEAQNKPLVQHLKLELVDNQMAVSSKDKQSQTLSLYIKSRHTQYILM